jgi:predicted secreted protein
MPKAIEISNDAGTTWDPLPSGNATFESESEAISDTVFDQTFESSEIGLINWKMTADGIFKGYAGYLANVLKQGSSTAIGSAEAMTLVSGKTYSIDDGVKDIWDRASSITFKDNAVLVSAANISSIDYLFGRVTFISSYTVTGPVTMATGSYFPTVVIGSGNAYTLGMTAATKDTTDFTSAQANSGHRTFTAGLRTVTLEIQGIYNSTENAAADLTARTELICEIDPAGDGQSIARGFFKIVNTGQSGAVGSLEDETINFALTVPIDNDEPPTSVFNWRHTSTTLKDSIQWVLTSWLTELNTYQVRYLPQGTIGQTPTDGHSGAFVVTDISLSGGLSNMNVFAISLQGTGATTTV